MHVCSGSFPLLPPPLDSEPRLGTGLYAVRGVLLSDILIVVLQVRDPLFSLREKGEERA